MRRRNGLNGAPQITWVNIIATLGLIATLGGGAWLLFQNQFSNIQSEMRSADSALLQDIKDNQTELNRLREKTLSRDEHAEYVKRMDSDVAGLQKRLDVLEATRPTTGELQSTGSSLRSDITDVKTRLQFLEQSPRPTMTQVPPHQ